MMTIEIRLERYINRTMYTTVAIIGGLMGMLTGLSALLHYTFP